MSYKKKRRFPSQLCFLCCAWYINRCARWQILHNVKKGKGQKLVHRSTVPAVLPQRRRFSSIDNFSKIYPDPEKFDPERFNEENLGARHPYAYLPFGEGLRICIGMRFGLMQTKVALISTLSKFNFKTGPKTQKKIEIDAGVITLMAKGGINLIIESR